jgi:ribonuclease HII
MSPPYALAELRCTRKLELLALREGRQFIAGCDESGRGALLGPLYAAAVILGPAISIRGIDDSKKLSAHQREALAKKIRSKALAWQVVAVTAEEVDAINVYEASRQGMLRALKALNPVPDFILTDAMPLREGGMDFIIPHRPIIHGDAISVSIAAASILAKVARDEHLGKLDGVYPQYGLAQNKGYGTPDHISAIARFGPCAEHRKTYQPVKDYFLPLFTCLPQGVFARESSSGTSPQSRDGNSTISD